MGSGELKRSQTERAGGARGEIGLSLGSSLIEPAKQATCGGGCEISTDRVTNAMRWTSSPAQTSPCRTQQAPN